MYLAIFATQFFIFSIFMSFIHSFMFYLSLNSLLTVFLSIAQQSHFLIILIAHVTNLFDYLDY
jgi:hypothetical protein